MSELGMLEALERRNFEEWAAKRNYNLKRDYDHTYLKYDMAKAWDAWQARAEAESVIREARQPEQAAKQHSPVAYRDHSDAWIGCSCGWEEFGSSGEDWMAHVAGAGNQSEQSAAPDSDQKCKYHRPDALYCLDCIPPNAPLSVLLVGTRKPSAEEIEQGQSLAGTSSPLNSATTADFIAAMKESGIALIIPGAGEQAAAPTTERDHSLRDAARLAEVWIEEGYDAVLLPDAIRALSEKGAAPPTPQPGLQAIEFVRGQLPAVTRQLEPNKHDAEGDWDSPVCGHEAKIAELEAQIDQLQKDQKFGDPLVPFYDEYATTKPVPQLTYSGWLRMVVVKILAGEKLPVVTGGSPLSNSDQAKLIAGLERRLYEAGSEVDRLKAEAVTGGAAPDRIAELAERLVAPGAKAEHVSASECHEIRDFIVALAGGAAQPTPETRFDEFDDESHPANKWWKEHGQYMRAGGGRNEFIWACRGWIAREQMACGVEITGDSLHENRADSRASLDASKEKRVNV